MNNPFNFIPGLGRRVASGARAGRGSFSGVGGWSGLGKMLKSDFQSASHPLRYSLAGAGVGAVSGGLYDEDNRFRGAVAGAGIGALAGGAGSVLGTGNRAFGRRTWGAMKDAGRGFKAGPGRGAAAHGLTEDGSRLAGNDYY